MNNNISVQDEKYCQYLINFYTTDDVKAYFNDFAAFVGSFSKKIKILDLGCGIGHFSYRLLKQGHNVVSLDVNPFVLEYAKKSGWIKNPIKAEVEKIPLPSNSVDAVFFLDVIEHLKNPLQSLIEIKRVLRNGGQLFLITPNSLYGRLFGDKGELDPTHIHEFGWFELKKILQQQGFDIIKAQASGLPLINRISHSLSRNMAKILNFLALPIASPSFWLKAEIKK